MGYSGFPKYLEESGYDFNDFGFIDIYIYIYIYIYVCIYIYIIKNHHLVNCMPWLHMSGSTVGHFAFVFGKVLLFWLGSSIKINKWATSAMSFLTTLHSFCIKTTSVIFSRNMLVTSNSVRYLFLLKLKLKTVTIYEFDLFNLY